MVQAWSGQRPCWDGKFLDTGLHGTDKCGLGAVKEGDVTNRDRNEELNHTLAADIHAEVESVAQQWSDALERGRGIEAINPFTKEKVELNFPPAIRALHSTLESMGLEKDPQLLSTLRNALASVSHAAMYEVLKIIDGSREFESGTRVDLSVDGEILGSFLHVIYHPESRG